MISIFPRRGASRVPGRDTSGVYAWAVCILLAVPGFSQEADAYKAAVTPLSTLLEEAERNNPQIQAARDGTKAARQVPAQVTALPDPTAQLQQVNVGSPRPFAGYSNSEFANVGLGISQDIPYPGKLKLRGEVAKRDADIAGNRADSVARAVLAQVKDAYFHLGYLSETLSILKNDRQLLKQMEQAADARYRSGMGSQQDVLQAQLQQTKLLRDISAHHLEAGKIQVSLKQLLSRPQSSPDIEPAPLKETPLNTSYDELLSAAQSQNPDLAATQNMIERHKLQVDAAHKDFYPDFNVGFMYDRTDPVQFRAQYVFTVGIKIPLHHEKQRSELTQAVIELDRSRNERVAQTQQLAADLQQQYLVAQQTAEMLKINREGSIPQARAGFQAGLAAYRNNRQEFQALLSSYLDILRLEQENWQSLADHETALARLEQMTGLSLLGEKE